MPYTLLQPGNNQASSHAPGCSRFTDNDSETKDDIIVKRRCINRAGALFGKYDMSEFSSATMARILKAAVSTYYRCNLSQFYIQASKSPNSDQMEAGGLTLLGEVTRNPDTIITLVLVYSFNPGSEPIAGIPSQVATVQVITDSNIDAAVDTMLSDMISSNGPSSVNANMIDLDRKKAIKNAKSIERIVRAVRDQVHGSQFKWNWRTGNSLPGLSMTIETARAMVSHITML